MTDKQREWLEILIEKSSIKINLTNKDDFLKATAQVVLAECIEINGFRISLSKNFEGLWLQPPSYSCGNGWKKTFWLDDKALWKQLEDKILKEYNNKIDSHYI